MTQEISPFNPADEGYFPEDEELTEVAVDGIAQVNLTLEKIASLLQQQNIRLERAVQALERAYPGSPNMTVQTQPVAAQPVPWQVPSQTADLAAGVCPVHNIPWKQVPAGIAKSGPRVGQAYPAFWACQIRDCRESPRT